MTFAGSLTHLCPVTPVQRNFPAPAESTSGTKVQFVLALSSLAEASVAEHLLR